MAEILRLMASGSMRIHLSSPCAPDFLSKCLERNSRQAQSYNVSTEQGLLMQRYVTGYHIEVLSRIQIKDKKTIGPSCRFHAVSR
jgi:hypothetical protein